MRKISKRKHIPLDQIPTPQQLLEDDLYLTSDEEEEFDSEAYNDFVQRRYGPDYNADLDATPPHSVQAAEQPTSSCYLSPPIPRVIDTIMISSDSDFDNDEKSKRKSSYKCNQCDSQFTYKKELMRHRVACRPDPIPSIPHAENHSIIRDEVQQALNNTVRIIRLRPSAQFSLPREFLNDARSIIQDTIDILIHECNECKINATLCVQISRTNPSGNDLQVENFYFSIASRVLDEFFIDDIIAMLDAKVAFFMNRGSNWQIDGVKNLELNVTRYNSIRQVAGRSNYWSRELPPNLKSKKAVVNVYNPGHDCFRYALLSVLHYNDVDKKCRNRPYVYTPWLDEHNWEGITWPVNKTHLKLFEKNNPGILINLLEWRGEENPEKPLLNIRPAPRPKTYTDNCTVVSILSVWIDNIWHYVGVTNVDRLINSQGKNRTFCERCLIPLFYGKKGETKASKKEKHQKVCYMTNPDSVMMTEQTSLTFTKMKNTQRLPYVMYGDIECFLQPDSENSLITHHVPCSIGLLLTSHPEMKAKPLEIPYTSFTGPHCIKEACDFIEAVGKTVYKWNQDNAHQKAIMSREERRTYKSSTQCYICSKVFDHDEVKKICEHDHLTGKYRGAACQDCNTKMRLDRTCLPVFFHNLRGYDGHILCQSAFGEKINWELEVIPITKEKYLGITAKYVVDSFSKKKGTELVNVPIKMKIKFKDSLQFLSAGLDSLVHNLDESQLQYSKECIPTTAPLSLITSKGIFPYEWFDDVSKLEWRNLPSQECFYDK